MKKVLLATVVGLLASTGVFAQTLSQSYLQSQSGVVKSGTGLCWLTLGDKNSEEQCGDLVEKHVHVVKAPVVIQPSRVVPVTAPVVAPVIEKKSVNVQVDLNILFSFDSSKLNSSSKTTLKEWANKYNIQHVRITGHADQIGKVNYNETLSLKRANVVKQYLLSIGVSEQAFDVVKGVGKTQPVVNCNPLTIECEADNRRVNIEAVTNK